MYNALYYYLWVAPHAFLAVVVILMLRRRFYKEFPMFLCYAVYQVLGFGVLFVLGTSKAVSPGTFYDAVLLDSGISIALRFGVIHEIFENVFRNYAALSRLGELLFRWASIVLVLTGTVGAGLAYSEGLNHLGATLWVTNLAVSIVQCGLLLLLFLFSRYFGLSWRNYVFGIAFGLGVYACVDLTNSTILSHFGLASVRILNLLTMGTYHCCVLIWIAYLLTPEPAMRSLQAPAATELHNWNHELERLLQQ
ncbi:MAG TPA: hypothetical protein VFA89_04485 [Terriglobales bacterium]|nr:hypothetical protein [Terriglobales bacterium]